MNEIKDGLTRLLLWVSAKNGRSVDLYSDEFCRTVVRIREGRCGIQICMADVELLRFPELASIPIEDAIRRLDHHISAETTPTVDEHCFGVRPVDPILPQATPPRPPGW